jgi:hypothetical protein
MNESINFLGIQIEPKAHETIMNGKKRPNKKVKIQVKVLVQPSQRGFGGTGLGPDTNKAQI